MIVYKCSQETKGDLKMLSQNEKTLLFEAIDRMKEDFNEDAILGKKEAIEVYIRLVDLKKKIELH
jgi:hypothetical protein